MEKTIRLGLSDKASLLELTKALSNSARVDILKLLSYESLSVDEISKKLDSPLTTVASNIAILEKAGLIRTKLQSGKRGTMKLCSIVYENISFDLVKAELNNYEDQEMINIPIGNYFNFDVKPTCGLVSEEGYLAKDDEPRSFATPDRFKAQLIWFHEGFIEYKAPFDKTKKIKELALSLELCSEAPYFRNVWPSDITLFFNDVEIGTWKCPGDFGGRQGNYTPEWWGSNSTQFGLLKTWKVDKTGSYIDFISLSDINIYDLFKKYNKDFISFKIMIKSDAKNVGGVNIFGEKFGDFPQGIVLKITYESI